MQIERITYEHFGATSNIYHKPILVPCSVCRERDKAVPAYWISLCGTLKLCTHHARGHNKIGGEGWTALD